MNFVTVLIAIPATVLVIAGLAIIRGLVVSYMWGWFMVPIFALPEISIVPAIGIAMTLSYLIKGLPEVKKEEWKEILLRNALGPLSVLSVGYIVHLFM